MSFVRAKKIKGKKYAYLVENTWEKKKVKQKVKEYLGRIIECKQIKENSVFLDFEKKPQEIIFDLIKRDLLRLGFAQVEEKIFILEEVTVDCNTYNILKKNKPCVLEINHQYLYKNNLSQLCNYHEPETTDSQPGKKLAKLLMSSGIEISPEEFIQLYKKLYLEQQN
jgi:hypothetical protein